MSHQILSDFSAPALIPAIEESLREFWGNWGRAPASELYDGPDMLRLYTGVPYAFFNGVVCSQLSSDTMDARIDETIAYFAARRAPWEWVVGPHPTPASLAKALQQHGLSVHGESIGMAIDLRAMRQDLPSKANLSILPVSDEESLQAWAQAAVAGFESPELDPGFADLERSLGYRNPAYRRYLGLLDGRPVSTSALYLGARVAGIYCVSTLPAARGLGIGAAITLRALLEARALGYHIAVLQATQMGRGVYLGLGFQEFSVLKEYSPK